jgi:hypothetical protein
MKMFIDRIEKNIKLHRTVYETTTPRYIDALNNEELLDLICEKLNEIIDKINEDE